MDRLSNFRGRLAPTGPMTRPTVGPRPLPVGWLALLGLLTVGVPLALALGLDGDAGLNVLRRHHLELLSFVAVEPVVAALLFMVVFALSVAISLPGVSFLTMVGGFLFGWLQAALFVQISATLAAAVVFLLARRALARPVGAYGGPAIQRLAGGFKRNALGYVMLLNLVPIVPFGMIIAVPAACGVRLWTFVIGGFLGILPGTILLAHLGSGLGGVLRQSGPLEAASFLSPQIMVALAGLAALSLLPLAWRRLKRRAA